MSAGKDRHSFRGRAPTHPIFPTPRRRKREKLGYGPRVRMAESRLVFSGTWGPCTGSEASWPVPKFGYSVSKSSSVSVWFPLASIARTSTLYSMPGCRYAAGILTVLAPEGRSTLNTRSGSSCSTIT